MARLKVVAQKADPQAVIRKCANGKGFETRIINVLEDGTERPCRVARTRKKDLLPLLAKLPVSEVHGMEIDIGSGYDSVVLEIFGCNAVY